MSFWSDSLLMLTLLSTAAGDNCRQNPEYSDIRMNQPSKTPVTKVLDSKVGLVQIYFNESYETNEIAAIKTNQSWYLRLHHLFDVDDGTFQDCIMNGTKDTESQWCKLKILTRNESSVISKTCLKCHFNCKLHSKRHFLHKTNTNSQDVKWLFKYVYSGWYILSNNYGNTVSAPFRVETNYTKDDLREKPLYPVIKNLKNSTVSVTISGEALDNDCANPTINSSCVQIELSHNQQKFMIYYDKKKGIKSYCSIFKNQTIMTNVRWNNDLYFELPNLPTGIKIAALVKILDSRCTRGVWNWDDKKGETCLWISMKYNVPAYDGNRTYPELPKDMSKKPLLSASLVAIIGILAAVIIAVRSYLEFRHKRRPSPFPPLPSRPSNHQPPPSCILLLYARDCNVFMEAMDKFRLLLQESTLVPVYDIWDEKRRNELDVQGDLWAMNYLELKNAQVIIVVTPVSRAIERSIIRNQWPPGGSLYDEPNSLDEVFVSAFRTCIQLTHTHPERCRKFIVTRLHTIGCVENQFISLSEQLCTIYTLPSHLHLVFGHVLDGQWDPQNLSTSDYKTFETKVEELDDFLKLNPAYEETLLSIIHSETNSNTFECFEIKA
ncbi:hypothetical protein GE061_017031 [Apolygus lucorum]|uniref:Uncharacterized protein n=1 Tax=Apolygus lucorum TaxID=248454 RepID=A0A6A4JTD8_APOLU|nr:hypothetical protein GE061_017031 [Apolygus lucorum]